MCIKEHNIIIESRDCQNLSRVVTYSMEILSAALTFIQQFKKLFSVQNVKNSISINIYSRNRSDRMALWGIILLVELFRKALGQ